MVPPDSTGIPRVPAYLGTPAAAVLAFRVQDCHLLWSAVPGAFCYAFRQRIAGAPQPRRRSTPPVWALPISLAATPGISFDFFSSGYLDVSVPRVGALKERRGIPRQVSPFGHPRIDACLQLPEAYRSLPRPSSPTRTKASPVCASLLDQHKSLVSHQETCTKIDARFTQSPGRPRICTTTAYEVPKTLSHKPMLSRSSGIDRKSSRGCCIAIRVSRKQAGRLSRAFRSAVRPTYSASPERR